MLYRAHSSYPRGRRSGHSLNASSVNRYVACSSPGRKGRIVMPSGNAGTTGSPVRAISRSQELPRSSYPCASSSPAAARSASATFWPSRSLPSSRARASTQDSSRVPRPRPRWSGRTSTSARRPRCTQARPASSPLPSKTSSVSRARSSPGRVRSAATASRVTATRPSRSCSQAATSRWTAGTSSAVAGRVVSSPTTDPRRAAGRRCRRRLWPGRTPPSPVLPPRAGASSPGPGRAVPR